MSTADGTNASTEPNDARSVGASSVTPDVLTALLEAAFVSRGDEAVARRVARLLGEPDGWPAVLVALAIRALREGSSALRLDEVATVPAQVERGHEDDVDVDLPLLGESIPTPSADELASLVAASAFARNGVVHVEDGLLTLDRYYRDEVLIADLIAARHRTTSPPPAEARARVEEALVGVTLDPSQRQAVESVLDRSLTVLTGGPGMGKTYTLAAVIRAVRAAFGDDLRLALAAPTGKAAARMTEALRENGVDASVAPDAVTLHRLLGFDRTNLQRFVHDASNPLPQDLVIVDEASMLSLALMARLIEALKPTARILLVGDPDQLASVEAGSVLSDLVAGLDASCVVRLTTHHRLSASRRDLARAFAAATPDEQAAGVQAVLTDNEGDVHHLTDPEITLEALPHVAESAWALRQAAARGDADAALDALRHHRLLCAHRRGPYGVARWNRLIEESLIERGVDLVPGRMYVGRPVIVTTNDRSLGLFNGDTGVVIERDGHLVVLMDRGQRTASDRARLAQPGQPAAQRTTVTAGDPADGSGPADRSGAPAGAQGGPRRGRTEFSPWRLADVETMHAMTVHKAQGSQAEHVTVIVPPLGSRLLTREMLYTAMTRASRELTVVGSDEAIAHAVRTPVRRASGLGRRLRAAADDMPT